jgi:hypothetical protein
MSSTSWSNRDGPVFRPKMGRARRGVEPAAGLTMKRAVLQRLARALGIKPRPPGQEAGPLARSLVPTGALLPRRPLRRASMWLSDESLHSAVAHKRARLSGTPYLLPPSH